MIAAGQSTADSSNGRPRRPTIGTCRRARQPVFFCKRMRVWRGLFDGRRACEHRRAGLPSVRPPRSARSTQASRPAWLLTLTGPGGSGKTRLALRVASESRSAHPDGVWIVDLASLPGGEFVTAQLAMTLDVGEPERGSTLDEAVCRRVAGWRTLIALDNCEHVAAAAADLAARLLAAAPNLKVIATSREPTLV
jgi:hypothetical protein